MVKFYQHIEKLLAQHDYVVVPNLGGFMVQMQSAKILSNRITPPHATIGFNPLMHHADGLLAIEISRTEQISYRKAVEHIDKEVEDIKFRLKTNGNAVIGNLGILQQSELKTLIFSPIYNSSFLPQNLGLSDLYVSNRKSKTVKEDRTVTLTLPSRQVFKYVAAAILILGFLVISPRVSDMRQGDYANLASVSFEKRIAEIQKDTLQKTVKIQVPATVTKLKTVTKKVIAEKSLNYHVIVASLPTQSSAKELCNTLKHDKFIDAHVLASQKRYRVAIQSFTDRKLAIEFMESLRNSDSRYETAWVFCDK